MNELLHRHPHEDPKTPSRHFIDLIVDGRMAGRAQLSYFSRPFPLYQIQALDIFSGHEGRGFWGKGMHFLEDMLKKNGNAGTLLDSIEPESPASGMFARRGWVEVPRT